MALALLKLFVALLIGLLCGWLIHLLGGHNLFVFFGTGLTTVALLAYLEGYK